MPQPSRHSMIVEPQSNGTVLTCAQCTRRVVVDHEGVYAVIDQGDGFALHSALIAPPGIELDGVTSSS